MQPVYPVDASGASLIPLLALEGNSAVPAGLVARVDHVTPEITSRAWVDTRSGVRGIPHSQVDPIRWDGAVMLHRLVAGVPVGDRRTVSALDGDKRNCTRANLEVKEKGEKGEKGEKREKGKGKELRSQSQATGASAPEAKPPASPYQPERTDPWGAPLPRCVYRDLDTGTYYARRSNGGLTERGPERQTPGEAASDLLAVSDALEARLEARRKPRATRTHTYRPSCRIALPAVLSSTLPLVVTDLDAVAAYLTDAPGTYTGQSASQAWGSALLAGNTLPAGWRRQASGRIISVGPCLQVIPSSIRPYLHAPEGHTLVDLDWHAAHATIASEAHGDGESMRYIWRRLDTLAERTGLPRSEVKRQLIAWLNGGGVHPYLAGVLARRAPKYDAYRTSTRYAPTSGNIPLIPWDASTTLCLLAEPRAHTQVLALRLQALEARAMDDVLLALPAIEGARLVATMYDGLLVALPCTPDEVRGHPALRAVVRAMRTASRERWGVVGGVKVRWGETWAMGAGEVVVPGDP